MKWLFRWFRRLFRRERLIVFPPDFQLLSRPFLNEDPEFKPTPEQCRKFFEKYGDSIWDDSRDVVERWGKDETT